MMPLKVYILTFYNMMYFDQNDQNFLDSRPEVLNWLSLFPSVFIVSQYSSYELSEIFRQQYLEKQFVITLIEPTDSNGYMPQQVWDFINHPKAVEGKSYRPTLAEQLNYRPKIRPLSDFFANVNTPPKKAIESRPLAPVADPHQSTRRWG